MKDLNLHPAQKRTLTTSSKGFFFCKHPFVSIFSILAITLIFIIKPALAQTSVTVTAGVGDTTLTITGKTSPTSQVYFIENNSIIGTTASDENGDFYKHLTAQDPDIIEFMIYSTDSTGQVSKPRYFSVNLAPYGETHLANVVLPPTLNISATHLTKGETIHVYGYTAPSSTVTLFFFDSTISQSAVSDEEGYWELYLDTNELNGGNHIVYAAVTVGTGHISSDGYSRSFTVIVESLPEDADEESGSGDSSKKSSKSSELLTTSLTSTSQTFFQTFICQLPDFLSIFDRDENCKVDTGEFVESVRAWFRLRQSGDPNCDINFDGQCNLRDFSFLLYYINR